MSHPPARGTARTRRAGASRPGLLLSVPSDTSFLGLVRDLTRRMAENAGFDPGTASRLALAVDEAATNVIEHAYRGAPDKRLEVHYEESGSEFRVDVVDTGAMVDPHELPRFDAERYISERRTGGIGVHLMEKIMDSVTYRRTAHRNVCCLIKRKEPATEIKGR